jgi:hypothetical protein
MTVALTYLDSNIQEEDIKPEQRVMLTVSLKYLGTYGYTTDAFSTANAEPGSTLND